MCYFWNATLTWVISEYPDHGVPVGRDHDGVLGGQEVPEGAVEGEHGLEALLEGGFEGALLDDVEVVTVDVERMVQGSYAAFGWNNKGRKKLWSMASIMLEVLL